MQMIKLVCCNHKDADQYYNFLLTQKNHFAIIFVDEDIHSFIHKFADIKVMYYHGNNKEEDHLSVQHNYNIAFLVHSMALLSHAVLIKYENKIHKMIPDGYKYCFSYHKEFPFYRSWPIYMPRGPVNDEVMMINPYDKGYENIIVQSLYNFKAKYLKESGKKVSIYHYFPNALSLSDLLLRKYNNDLFSMKESDTRLADLRLNPVVMRMKNAQIFNLENLLVASKMPMFEEISRYLDITPPKDIYDASWLLDPGIVVDTSKPRLIVCLDSLLNEKETYLPYFHKLFSLYESCGYNITEIVKINGEYRILDRINREVDTQALFILIKNADMYIGTDYMLAQISGLFNVANYIIMFEEPERYNPPVRKHAVLKVNMGVQMMPVEDLFNLTQNFLINAPEEPDVDQYKTLKKIEI